jgi:molecular chaperone GrpE
MPKKKKKKIFDDETLENVNTNSEMDQPESIEDELEDEDDYGEIEEEIKVEEALEDDSISFEEKLELVKAAWAASEEKACEYLDGWQRSKAEFSNYKKRVNRDRDQYGKDAVGRVVKNYLPVLDDLERALKEKPVADSLETWVNGIELIYRKLALTMENDGVLPMEVTGEMFDPNLHEAVAQIESEGYESGQIVDVIQTGYRIGERVLRPAKVCIAA